MDYSDIFFGEPRRRPSQLQLGAFMVGLGFVIQEDSQSGNFPAVESSHNPSRQSNESVNSQPASSKAIRLLKMVPAQESDKCAICMTDFKRKESATILPCGHLYHGACILRWLHENNTCPYCRYTLLPLFGD